MVCGCHVGGKLAKTNVEVILKISQSGTSVTLFCAVQTRRPLIRSLSAQTISITDQLITIIPEQIQHLQKETLAQFTEKTQS